MLISKKVFYKRLYSWNSRERSRLIPLFQWPQIIHKTEIHTCSRSWKLLKELNNHKESAFFFIKSWLHHFECIWLKVIQNVAYIERMERWKLSRVTLPLEFTLYVKFYFTPLRYTLAICGKSVIYSFAFSYFLYTDSS